MTDMQYLDQLLAIAGTAPSRTDRAAARAEARRVLDKLERRRPVSRGGGMAGALRDRLEAAPHAATFRADPSGWRTFTTDKHGRVWRVS